MPHKIVVNKFSDGIGMYCQNRIIHTIQAGDSLYKLSRQYKTTVSELILGNPGVNPYQLQIGMELAVCPGPGYEGDRMGAPGQESPAGAPGQGNFAGAPGQGSFAGAPGQGSFAGAPGKRNCARDTEGRNEEDSAGEKDGTENNGLENPEGKNRETLCAESEWEMSLAWLSHVYWSRMYQMSVLSDSPDQQETEERLLETADEIAGIFANLLSPNATRQLRNLLMEHIEIAGEMIHALKAGLMENYDGLLKEWYANADRLAGLPGARDLCRMGEETKDMLYRHLDLARGGMEHLVNGEYRQSIDTFQEMVDQAAGAGTVFCSLLRDCGEN